MTINEYKNCNNLYLLFCFISPQNTRKRKLFIAACCYQIWDKMTHQHSRNVVTTLELFADHKASSRQLKKARQLAWTVTPMSLAANAAAQSAYVHLDLICANNVVRASSPSMQITQCHLFRDIFPHPEQNLPTLPHIPYADIIYQDKLFDELPLLADHLLDMNITHTELLDHLKDTSIPHTRGCWALDLLRKDK